MMVLYEQVIIRCNDAVSEQEVVMYLIPDEHGFVLNFTDQRGESHNVIVDVADANLRVACDKTHHGDARIHFRVALPDGKQTKCSRGACGLELTKGRMKIWNDPSHRLGYRNYCLNCGRAIRTANPDIRWEVCE